jgi:hypothetical protein
MSNPTPDQYRQHARDIARAFGLKLLEVTTVATVLTTVDGETVTVGSQPFKPEDAAAVCDPQNAVSVELPRGSVLCAPITDSATYTVAMHELGHVLHPQGSLAHEKAAARKANDMRRYLRLVVLSEESAWEWAKHHALDWTTASAQVESYALATYREQLAGVEALCGAVEAVAQDQANQVRAAHAARVDPHTKRVLRDRAERGARAIQGWLKK